MAGLEIQHWVIVGVALGVSLLTLYSMVKIWNYAFLRPAPQELPDLDQMARNKQLLFFSPMIVFTVIAVGIGIFAGPVFDYAQAAAEQLMDPESYIRAVLGGD